MTPSGIIGTVAKEQFRDLIAAAVKEGLDAFRVHVLSGKWVPKYYDWPRLTNLSGFPSFATNVLDAPLDYSELLHSWSDSPAAIPPQSLQSFRVLLSYLEDHLEILSVLEPITESTKSELANRMKEASTFGLVGNLIDRYIHVYKSFDFDMEHFEHIYRPIECFVFGRDLEFDLCIPLLFVTSDIDTVVLSEGISVERIDDSYQLARAKITEYSHVVNETVMAAATHWVVIHNLSVTNDGRWNAYNRFRDLRTYPLDKIDNVLACTRAALGIDVGYAQLIVRPIGWAMNYQADLPLLTGMSIRSYPPKFDSYYWWSDSFPHLNSDDWQVIGNLYSKLQKGNSTIKLQLAARRLNSCHLREHEEDVVLDAVIGLEILLSDNAGQEMTYKLGMRMAALYAALSSDERPYSPSDIFRAMKGIYSYRSKVVHGGASASDKRKVKMSNGDEFLTDDLAVLFLRLALVQLVNRLELRDPTYIDSMLLLGTKSA